MSPQTQWLIGATARGGAGLLIWSWQAFVLLGCVWLGLKLFRVRLPAMRCHIWLIGLIAIATAPLWGAAVERLGLPVSLPAPAYQMLRDAGESPQRAITFSPSISVARKPDETRSFSLSKPIVLSVFFFLWLLGAAIASAQIIRQWIRLRRIRSMATPIGAEDLDCHDLSDREARLALSTEIRSPVTTGVFRPVILAPADIAEWTSEEERRAILRHELAHIDRRDAQINILINTLGVLFFFHPMVRYAIRRLGIEREIACDDRVVNEGADAASYAQSLYKVAERCVLLSGSPGGVHGLALISAKDILERRIEMILNKDRVRVIAKQWRYILLAALLVAGVAWFLIPARTAKPGLAQGATAEELNKWKEIESLDGVAAHQQLLTMAIENSEPDNRRMAANRLLDIDSDPASQSITGLYQQTNDPVIKRMIIRRYTYRGDMASLLRIATSEPANEYRHESLTSIKWLKLTSQDERIRSWDVSSVQTELDQLDPVAPPPPPPPPPGALTVELGKPPRAMPLHPVDDSIFAILRDMADASLRGDDAFFEKALDENYLETAPSGEVLNKAQSIELVKKSAYAFKKFEFDDLSVSGNQESALATFLGTVWLNDGGETTVQYRYSVIFRRPNQNDAWKVAAIHMTQKP